MTPLLKVTVRRGQGSVAEGVMCAIRNLYYSALCVSHDSMTTGRVTMTTESNKNGKITFSRIIWTRTTSEYISLNAYYSMLF